MRKCSKRYKIAQVMLVLGGIILANVSCVSQDEFLPEKSEVQEQTSQVEANSAITKEKSDILENNVFVKNAWIQSFLNGKVKAVLSERYVAICSEAELEYFYEGTIDEIVDGYFENSARYLNNQQKTDLVISSGELAFGNDEKFAYVLINGKKSEQ